MSSSKNNTNKKPDNKNKEDYKKELKECCGAYCSEAGCCPFPKK